MTDEICPFFRCLKKLTHTATPPQAPLPPQPERLHVQAGRALRAGAVLRIGEDMYVHTCVYVCAYANSRRQASQPASKGNRNRPPLSPPTPATPAARDVGAPLLLGRERHELQPRGPPHPGLPRPDRHCAAGHGGLRLWLLHGRGVEGVQRVLRLERVLPLSVRRSVVGRKEGEGGGGIMDVYVCFWLSC